jgi:hypothetical protein
MIKHVLVANTEMVVAELPLFAIASHTTWNAQRKPLAQNVYVVHLSSIHITDPAEAESILMKWKVCVIIGSGQNVTTKEDFILIQCPDIERKTHVVMWVSRDVIAHLLDDANEREAFGSCDMTVRTEFGIKDMRVFLWAHPFFVCETKNYVDQRDVQHEWNSKITARKSLITPSCGRSPKSANHRAQVRFIFSSMSVLQSIIFRLVMRMTILVTEVSLMTLTLWIMLWTMMKIADTNRQKL